MDLARQAYVRLENDFPAYGQEAQSGLRRLNRLINISPAKAKQKPK